MLVPYQEHAINAWKPDRLIKGISKETALSQ
jgi:hypothetical protein